MLFAGARVVGRDVLHYLAPLGAAVGAGLRGDGSLWWDGGVNLGLPLAARWSPMVFYPAQWLNAVLPPLTATSFAVIGHLVLACLAVRRLALRYTDSLPAAWVAALAFGTGGYLISVTVGGGYLYGAALLPLSLLAVHRLVEAPGPGRTAQAALVFALQLFVADPQTFFYEGVVLVPALLWGRGWRPAAAVGAAGALGLAIAACQWIPAAEYARLSVRAEGVGGADAWALHPLRLLQLWSPAPFGAAAPEPTFWARWLINAEFTLPWAPLIYVGLLPWAGIAAVRWGRREAVVAALTAFFALLALGPWTPLFGWVAKLPGASLFRYPEKFVLFVTLGLCLLAANGLGRLIADCASDAPEAARRRRAIGVGFAGLAVAAVVARQLADVAWLGATMAAHQVAHVDAAAAQAVTAGSLLHTALVAAAIAALVWAGRRVQPRLLLVAGGVLAAADVLPAALPQRYVADGAVFDAAPIACAALPTPALGLTATVFRPSRALSFKYDGQGDRFERQRRWEWDTLKPNCGTGICARHAAGYEAGQLTSSAHLWAAIADDERRFRLLGIERIIAAPGTLSFEQFPPMQQSPGLGVAVHAVRNPVPFALPVGAAQTVANDADAHPRLNALDPFATVLLERTAPSEDFGPAQRTVALQSYRPGEIALSADFERPGYLVVNETHYPGWSAGPFTVERANGHALGLQLPAGHSDVRLTFAPPLQRTANAISIAALVFLAGLVAFGTLRRRMAPA